MKSVTGIQVYSEIGQLKKVMLHRPGKEIENLTPDLMDRLLFDDIPYLEVAREEHDAFADIFKNNGVDVVYLENLAAEAIADEGVKRALIDEFISETSIKSHHLKSSVKDYFLNFDDNRALIDKMMEGIRKEEITNYEKTTLADMVASNYPFVVDPMPNLYFTRDPFSSIGTGISLNHMRTVTRNRETLFAKYVFDHHDDYKDIKVPKWYDRTYKYSIEGGDQLVLSNKVVAIGVSERTDAAAIDEFAKNIFADGQKFEVILAFDIPKKRAFMHLDTVFTMVDYNKFTIHPEIEGPLTVYSIRKGQNGKLDIEEETLELKDVLSKYLEVDDVELIRCGGGNAIDAGREQWNDGSNTLAIAPGEVIVYSRNHVTNKLLTESGVKLHIMPSSELSRGRGGPRCMSMPLYRELL
ncbi:MULTISPECIES: arginine deiminase [unclassified Fusibacter]|uniref:arginine deiminase n=1 Tax=unclassified Fusibacter TaxID=2624464 RepID=UPI00101146CC|nr:MULTISPECIES: arginine deiminase [unclassified Fusibacter]MCK8059295.1 arginine deiminase [Fusibacter sp. A2]NPE21241.1 arginine deiminase [Fusibacter sp. A1]RXV62506.1 arginine deiminase [Fusibacter sp. A1]